MERKEEESTKREELSFLPVLAFPMASSTGTDARTIFSTGDGLSVRADRNCKMSFVDSVFPAPDSPLYEFFKKERPMSKRQAKKKKKK